jgi:beta-glucanase (GH16 family)
MKRNYSQVRKLLHGSFAFLFFIIAGAFDTNAQIVVEAESYSQMQGVQTENTNDIGGGINVGWIDSGDWMEYTINVPIDGSYELTLRTASQSGGGQVELSDGSTVLQTVDITSTGGWQNWTDVVGASSINLSKGVKTVRINAKKGGFNLNWWKLTPVGITDSDKPSTPVVSGNSSTVHDVHISWNQSVDVTTAIGGYQIFNNGNRIAFTCDTSITISKLPPNHVMDFDIVANDLVGNISDTASVTVKTDTIPWEIVWRDEFNVDGEVDRTKRNFQVGGGGWGNGEAQYYSDGVNASVSGGNLIIEARKETHGGNSYTSSRLNSSGKGDFLFGRVEVRAKLPGTNGTWPAIWTLPTDWVYGNWPNCGEIDIMEHSATYHSGYILSTIHTGAYNHIAGTQKSGGIMLGDVSENFHTYILEWYPDHMDWYVDDVHIFTYENEYKSIEEWPFDVKHHVLLNVAIGGTMGGDIDANGVWPQQMLVDYVRIYDFKLDENDIEAPAPPAGLIADTKATSALISWNLTMDNYAIEKYYVLLDGILIDSVTGSEFLIQGLEPLTNYEAGVLAVDYSGNISDIAFYAFITPELSGTPIPGKIQAEDYESFSGVDTEVCEDEGGGINVGWIDTGDWMGYAVDVAEDDEYVAVFRTASQSGGGTISLLNDAESEIINVVVPGTGGWQNWVSVTTEPFNLTAGIQQVKVSAPVGGYNLNWIEIIKSADYVGVNEALADNVLVYPNPVVNEELNISVPDGIGSEVIVQIIALDGKVVFSENVNSDIGIIQLSRINIEPGVYIVKIKSRNFNIARMLEKL